MCQFINRGGGWIKGSVGSLTEGWGKENVSSFTENWVGQRGARFILNERTVG